MEKNYIFDFVVYTGSQTLFIILSWKWQEVGFQIHGTSPGKRPQCVHRELE
jgi:hypothetical protein